MIPKHILEKVNARAKEVCLENEVDPFGDGPNEYNFYRDGAQFMYELLSPELKKAKFSAEREDQSNALSVEHNMLTIKALEAKLKAREAQVEELESEIISLTSQLDRVIEAE